MKQDAFINRPMPAPRHGLTIGHGDDFTDNCRYLAEKLVRLEGKNVVVGGLPSSRRSRISVAKFQGGLDVRDALRDVVYDLLTSATDEVQKRFCINDRYVMDNGDVKISPDALLGGRLQREIKVDDQSRAQAKADSSKPT